MNIIDISIPIRQGMVVYSGNPDVIIEEIASQASKSIISKITFGSHTGTHIDAPKHAIAGAMSLDEVPLEAYFGTCRVIDCTQDPVSVSRESMERAAIQSGERILLKTRNSIRGYDTFYPDFIFLSPEAAEYLASRAILVGIDYFSIKQKGSTDNRPHTLLLEKNIPILEGIDLSKVETGLYTLVAFPLRLHQGDGAPSRAILIKTD
jgi:arylformamidase